MRHVHPGEQVRKSGSGRDGHLGGGGERGLSLGTIKGKTWSSGKDEGGLFWDYSSSLQADGVTRGA